MADIRDEADPPIIWAKPLKMPGRKFTFWSHEYRLIDGRWVEIEKKANQ